jgi:hypothetical protein
LQDHSYSWGSICFDKHQEQKIDHFESYIAPVDCLTAPEMRLVAFSEKPLCLIDVLTSYYYCVQNCVVFPWEGTSCLNSRDRSFIKAWRNSIWTHGCCQDVYQTERLFWKSNQAHPKRLCFGRSLPKSGPPERWIVLAIADQ